MENLTHIDKGGVHLNIICSELGLNLMQRHESCIEFLLLKGLVSTSSETHTYRLFTCYKSAKHITIASQYIGNPKDSKFHMPHNLSHRYSSGTHAHHLRFRASAKYMASGQCRQAERFLYAELYSPARFNHLPIVYPITHTILKLGIIYCNMLGILC